jgi:hypothetical protein
LGQWVLLVRTAPQVLMVTLVRMASKVLQALTAQLAPLAPQALTALLVHKEFKVKSGHKAPLD